MSKAFRLRSLVFAGQMCKIACVMKASFHAHCLRLHRAALPLLAAVAVASGDVTPAAAAPAILTEPQSVSQINGFPASFSVAATGAPPLTFQWRRGGTNLSGAVSNSYRWASVQPGNAGSYDVVVANPSGAVTSAPVTLTVLPNTASCSLTNLRLTPLNELGLNTHKGYAGGLYPGGLNYRPRAHDEAGRSIARTLVIPRNFSGNVETNNGRVVLLSIGMSNTTQEWASGANDGTNDTTVAFKYRADHDLSKHPRLVIVDAAQGGRDGPQWTNANTGAWTNVAGLLNAAGVGSNQVQVIWVKQAIAAPSSLGAFPAHALALQSQLGLIVRAAKSRFTNLAIVYLSSRTRSYAADASLNPEPYAYEGGFSVKWLIEQQINGQLNYDPARGPVPAPWLSWGPYLWADGTAGRSDGFGWQCSDLRSDFTHPSQSGVRKVADQLLNFFKTDPSAGVEIILYDRTPGGAGFVEEGKARWNEVLAAAIDICQTTPNHVCEMACYDCLKDFGNQSYHEKLNRQSVLRFFGVGS